MSYRPDALTKCLVQPPGAVLVAPDVLRLAMAELEIAPGPQLALKALSAFKLLQTQKAQALVRGIDWTAFEWFWAEGGNESSRRHNKTSHTPYAGVKAKPLTANVKRTVAERDHWTCRYCGLRVVTSATMAALERHLPAGLPMSDLGPSAIACHPMQCVMRLTWDHIQPLAQGGTSTPDNVVATCGTCNFQKGDCSLEELSLQNPLYGTNPNSQWLGLDGHLKAPPLRGDVIDG